MVTDGSIFVASTMSGTGVIYQLGTASAFGPVTALAATTYARAIAFGDADGDGQLDVYLLRSDVSGGTNPDDIILLNQRLVFTSVPVPPAGGLGDDVVALDGDRDGRVEFLVLNGAADALGPVQLISLYAKPQSG